MGEDNRGKREVDEKNKEEGMRKRVRSWRIVQKSKSGQVYRERCRRERWGKMSMEWFGRR